jgi:hypothetical protein
MDTTSPPSISSQFYINVRTGLKNKGINLCIATNLYSMMQEIGLEKVEEHIFPLPTDGVHAEAWKEAFRNGIDGFGKRPLRDGMGWSEEYVQSYLAEVRVEYERTGKIFPSQLRVVIGQKPA